MTGVREEVDESDLGAVGKRGKLFAMAGRETAPEAESLCPLDSYRRYVRSSDGVCATVFCRRRRQCRPDQSAGSVTVAFLFLSDCGGNPLLRGPSGFLRNARGRGVCYWIGAAAALASTSTANSTAPLSAGCGDGWWLECCGWRRWSPPAVLPSEHRGVE